MYDLQPAYLYIARRFNVVLLIVEITPSKVGSQIIERIFWKEAECNGFLYVE